MKNIIHLTSSPNGEMSYSNKLCDVIINKLLAKFPESAVNRRDLTHQAFPHVEGLQVAAYFTPPDVRTGEMQTAVQHSDAMVAELLDADIVVIGVPMHNFGIPSNLKAWIDHVVRAGMTFRFTETGAPEGLAGGKQVFLAIASDNIYSEGPSKAFDFAEPYMRTILGFIGITDITTFRVEGTAIPGIQGGAMERAMEAVVI